MELFIKAILLGVVEGITEFLPVSSTGHLILVNQFINFSGEFAKMFDVVIQLGAILSVIVYFWSRLYPFSRRLRLEERRERWEIWTKTIVAVVPAIIIGGAFAHKIEELLFNPTTVALALFVGGVLLVLVERRKQTGATTTVSSLTYPQVFAIGLFQCLAMIPGTSRSAATIIGAMLLGCSRLVAVEFSFFLAIPTMIAASVYSLYKHAGSASNGEWLALATGFAVSFLVAWSVIAFLMNYIRKHDFVPFAYYRIALAALIGILIITKSL